MPRHINYSHVLCILTTLVLAILSTSESRDIPESDLAGYISLGQDRDDLNALRRLLKADVWRRRMRDFSSDSDDIDLSEEVLNELSSGNRRRQYLPSLLTVRKRKVFWQPMPFVPHDVRQNSRDKDEGANNELPNSAAILRYGWTELTPTN